MREEQETLNNYIPKKKRKVMLRENPTEYREYLYKQKVYEMKMKKLEEMKKNGNTNVNVEDIELNEDELKEINGEIDGEMKMDESVLGSNNSNDVDIEKNTILKMLKTLSEKDIIKELRVFGEPIRYFGETDDERLIRLRYLKLNKQEKDEMNKVNKNEHIFNIQKEIDNELDVANAYSHKTNDNNDRKDDIKGNNNTNNNNNNERKSKYLIEKYRKDFDCNEDYVLYFFKRLLKLWENDLQNRSIDIKNSNIGKSETIRQKQTRRDIKPLFKQLKNRTVPRDVLDKSVKMAIYTSKREYVEAKRIFFEMAIGNAPWPMGVTMVGIHERSGRSKIFSSQIDHVLNDETQRKYIHAMERLMKFSQNKYPNSDPTKNVG